MTVAVLWANEPGAFAGGEGFTHAKPMTGTDAWRHDRVAVELRVHPMHIVDPAIQMALQLWQVWTGGGFGAGPLPMPGGLLRQPAWLWVAFATFSAAHEKIRKKGRN